MINHESADLWWRFTDLRILILAHDLWIRSSLFHYFECNGCEIEAFDNGKEGQEALSTESFDVIIADHALPDMSGLAFFRRIQPSSPQTLKILITAGRSDEISSAAHKMGIRIIVKPLTTDTIDETLTLLLEESEKIATD